MKVLERLFADSKLAVHVLVCVFAISSWVDINGMWVELPIFVTHLPEKWTLPSYITILSQIANIGPIIFFIVAYCVAKTPSAKTTLDKVTSYIIMLVGVTSTLLLAFLWQRTHYLAGSERSVALLVLSFFLSVMDCTSSVAYVAFMSILKPVYLSSFFIGEGLSGLLPAMMALGQGAGDIICVNGSSTQEKNISGVIVNVTTYFEYPKYLPPRFSVQIFFFLLSGMITVSIIAFCLLNNTRYCRDQFVTVSVYDLQATTDSDSSDRITTVSGSSLGIANPACDVDEKNNVTSKDQQFSEVQNLSSVLRSSKSESYGSNDTVSGLTSSSSGGGEQGKEGVPVEGRVEEEDLHVVKMVLLLAQVVLVNFLITSFLLSVQTYSSLPYGISVYNLVVTLTNIANPVACLISMFLAVASPLVITGLTSLGVACGAYIIVAASMSPEPPLVGLSSGGPVVVVVWVGASFFLTYAKVSVAGVMRHVGRHALIWYGVATQVGALLGAITGFVLVNEAKVFLDASWC